MAILEGGMVVFAAAWLGVAVFGLGWGARWKMYGIDIFKRKISGRGIPFVNRSLVLRV